MLSYRHSYHAGNYADVLKHIVTIEVLQHLLKKDKPFTYVDTHSGAGLFNLKGQHAQKLQEHSGGIGKLIAAASTHAIPELDTYLKTVQRFTPNAAQTLQFYPGSPLIALQMLRPTDKACFFELHPQDYEFLKHNSKDYRNCAVHQSDGLKGLLGQLPPPSRRGFALIDPSYEIKSEYREVTTALIAAHKKFATGTFALWYPVVNRQNIEAIERQVKSSKIRNIQRFELGLCEDTTEHGMTASGMIVINPPWGLFKKMSSLLPKLVTLLKGPTHEGQGHFKCDVLAEE